MDFVTAVKEFDRMSTYYDECPEECPLSDLAKGFEWEDWWMEAAYNPVEWVAKVEDWAKKHPRPIYPTFSEVVNSMCSMDGMRVPANWSEIADKPIPEIAAKRFGIIPINECGLQKYSDEKDEIKEWI